MFVDFHDYDAVLCRNRNIMTFRGQFEIDLRGQRKVGHSLHGILRDRKNAAHQVVANKPHRIVVSDLIHRNDDIVKTGGPRVFLPEQIFNPQDERLIILTDLFRRILL